MSRASSYSLHLHLPLLFVLVICQVRLEHVNAGESVEYLPGFEGPLPFHLETGYVGVDEGEDVQVFYYFVKSERNPREDPLMLWITGGPGCSSLIGLLYEIGPITFMMMEYNGTLPKLVLNPNSWTKMANIIFVDLPVRTGFTYTKTPTASDHPTDIQFSYHAYEFMKKWLTNHPEFISNPFYVGGDSYSGMIVPVIAQLISNGNEAGIEQFKNLRGYILGNPVTNSRNDNYRIQFAHGMGLIPDDLYELLKKNCGGEYRKEYIDPNNIHCLQHLKAYDKCVNGIQSAQILEPFCGFAFPRRPINSLRKNRLLEERVNELYNVKQSLSAFKCRVDGFWYSYKWADDENVQDALHIRKGTIGKWKRCSTVDLKTFIPDVKSFHLSLSKRGYRSLIYSGDHDMMVPHQATQAWIKDLSYSIVDQWRSWSVDGQIAGYTRSYSNNMTFATVKGGGHTAPEYKPEECFAMFKRWIFHQPL